LQRRAELARVATMHKLFLLPQNRDLIDNVLNGLAPVCAAEARFVLDQSEDLQSLYESTSDKVNECLDALHKELYTL